MTIVSEPGFGQVAVFTSWKNPFYAGTDRITAATTESAANTQTQASPGLECRGRAQ
jgi:hypothetical protein